MNDVPMVITSKVALKKATKIAQVKDEELLFFFLVV